METWTTTPIALWLARHTLPIQQEQSPSIGAQGYALQAYAAYGLDRSQPDYRYAQENAANGAQVLLHTLARQLRRLGRQGRLRPSQLYSPATGPVDNTTVLGP